LSSYTYALLFYRQTPWALALNIHLLSSHTRHLLLSIYHLLTAKMPLRDRQPRAFLTKRLDTLTIVRGIPKD
jgi:hypothetical protein